MFFGICTIALIALFCSLNIDFAYAEFPQNISPYNNKEWKYAQYKVCTVSNPDTCLITLTAVPFFFFVKIVLVHKYFRTNIELKNVKWSPYKYN
jgi:hypothetical protein